MLVVDDRKSSYERVVMMLSAEHRVEVESNPNEALFRAAEGSYDLIIVSLELENFDGLRLCSQIRSLDAPVTCRSWRLQKPTIMRG